jgi:hypothetical protein
MNKIYLITYDLREGQNYTPLHEAIKRSPKWWHHLESTWLIVTSETSVQVWNRLASHISKDDRLLVIEVKNNYNGWLKEKAWEWLANNFNALGG